MMSRSISSKKLIVLIMMIFTVPFTGFLLVYNFYTVNMLNNRIAETNQSRVEFNRFYLEENLHNVENFMANLVANDRSYGRLRYELTPLDAHLNTFSILEKFKDFLPTQKTAAALFIYTPKNELYRKVFQGDISSDEREEVDHYLRKLVITETDLGQRGWFTQQVGAKNYLFRILGGNGVFTIFMLDLSQATTPGNSSKQDSSNDIFLYSTTQGEALTSKKVVGDAGIVLKGNSDAYYISGKAERYFIVQSYSENAGINLVYAMRYHNFLGAMNPLSLSLLIASIVFIILLFVCFRLLKRNFFTPLSELVSTIERIRNGNIEAKISPVGRIEEFEQVSEAFNAMMDQIKRLKIVAYEQKLEAHRAKLEYLQIQIRPHFFLNILKNLYGLAEAESYKRIQKMILVLSDYLRFMIQEHAVTIPLSVELRNVETYVLLQQMSLSVPINCTIDVDTALNELQIPPLTILTFVENAVKHATVPHTTLKIHIKVRLLQNEDGEYINITILDNGPGFSDEALSWLNGGSDIQTAAQHVGIANVRRRFALIYENKKMFYFDRSNGSCVEIFIPYRNDIVGTEQLR
ncbi:sensor histidine kinase [Cohnella abietis]|uniref:HAMP domain-containing protein n=1 Tax=Cohnella abietis TaxID=2507935 RepID=A0A3T1D1K7_9BACL|nr:histidine kinase [Cohnella abietis]BBI31980.1 hypothetical protein KCTCHS21_13790 [Cohnella abietis]